ncbi:L-serine ammonia-lyase [Weeksellaceae bacterium TAE3-ERU29]|nr:L-serine ammonia-lyase [Weeksellaceae bacterium TAE3-ERU29]
MNNISVFDMLKIGVGPSSSHTLGPWRAAQTFIKELNDKNLFDKVITINIDLYGSLSLTGKGHATDLAILLGLSGTDPVTIPIENIDKIIGHIRTYGILSLDGKKSIPFDFSQITFNKEFLDYHSNGMTITAELEDDKKYSSTFFSIGGGFITKEETEEMVDLSDNKGFPYPTNHAKELLQHCNDLNKDISEVVLINELSARTEEEIDEQLKAIWQVMLESIYVGCHSEGFLPGGLMVRRRAYDMYQKLKNEKFNYTDTKTWLKSIRKTKMFYREIFKWVSTYAIAVNEVNASLGRVVTAPTNGSAGVIPAVLMFYLTVENHKASFPEIKKFLLTAGVVGSIFKRNATISAAMGGCQAEIGVSSAMAAAALCEMRGGTPKQCLNAAEIAMEHHLGLTCDPIDGLVQIPCIERNSMGAIKAINASELALDSEHFKVSLDEVISTMWETAKDMNSKYKETSEGGLAVSVKLVDC